MSPENDNLASLPLLALKNTVLYPYMFMPLSAGRPGSVAAVEAALATEEKALAVFAQRDAAVDQPGGDDLFPIGTRAVIKKMARTPEGVEMLVQGLERVTLVRLEQTEPYLRARVRPLPLPEDHDPETEGLYRAVLDQAVRIVELTRPQAPINIAQLAAEAEKHEQVVYLLASLLSLDLAKEQQLLEAPSLLEALRALYAALAHELQVLEVRAKIQNQVETEVNQQQKEFLLRQQLRAIQDELGETNPEKAELEELRKRLAEADLPDEVRKEADHEFGRLERLPAAAPDYQITRGYLEFILELPWRKGTEASIDLEHARQVLDEDHYGLKDIKERILEHLAVLKLNPKARAPILCLVGPPGVGKTSLGQSIARRWGGSLSG